jgi:hypothetical protein
MPNIRELLTIVDRTVYNPAIDTVAFPATPSSHFWSGSPHANYSDSAWLVNFNNGYAYNILRLNDFVVRLVRGGQSFGLLDITRPSADYVDQGDGTVRHTPTRLIWQRCAVGQSWTGITCSGTASTATWDAAKALTSSFAGQTDWHLPTEEELLSLVDYSKFSPAINATLFPNAPSSFFWSGSPVANYSDLAWYVGFYYGYAYGDSRNDGSAVRLVRGGQCFGPLVLSASSTGTGQITSMQCSTAASGYFAGDVVTLSASPAANLLSWGGACASAGTAATCSVTMNAAKTVTASFKDTPLVSGLPAALVFATQNIASTSAAQTVTLTNTGTAALNITSLIASGDFAVSNNCGAGLGAGGFCTLDVTFKPSASGTRTGTLTLSSDAPGSPHSISLSGTGQAGTTTLTLSTGWNLLGNGTDQPLAVASLFGDAAKVTSVWKWDAASTGWQFYMPSMDAPTLQSYTSGKGYGVLGSIKPGEGFWVNAVQPHSATQTSGTAISGNDFAAGKPYALKLGWNLVAMGTALTPSDFNNGLSATASTPGTVPNNIISLWAWDNPQRKWYFYAPKLEGEGGTALLDYIAGNGYLDFTANHKTLDPGMGFWVNRP